MFRCRVKDLADAHIGMAQLGVAMLLPCACTFSSDTVLPPPPCKPALTLPSKHAMQFWLSQLDETSCRFTHSDIKHRQFVQFTLYGAPQLACNRSSETLPLALACEPLLQLPSQSCQARKLNHKSTGNKACAFHRCMLLHVTRDRAFIY